MNKSLSNIEYSIVHATPGRIRISVPQLKKNLEYAKKLEQLLNSLDSVVRVRFNPQAASIAIRYDANNISNEVVQNKIAGCFEQAVSGDLYQQNQKFIKASTRQVEKVETEELASKIGGEFIGEIVGGALGHLLLGSIGERIASEVMSRAGGFIGESVSKEIADVAGLINHLESQATKQATKKPILKPYQQNQPDNDNVPSNPPQVTTGLTASQLEKLWQIPSSTINAQADKGVLAFQTWSQEKSGIRWSFGLSASASSDPEMLFFPCD
ncbi:HMA2 domain-containing protein [Tolypothrix bouteillei VB521301_2]